MLTLPNDIVALSASFALLFSPCVWRCAPVVVVVGLGQRHQVSPTGDESGGRADTHARAILPPLRSTQRIQTTHMKRPDPAAIRQCPIWRSAERPQRIARNRVWYR